jgi:hypothetical protein
VAGTPILVAISAPTALALQTAERAGITLVAIARADGFEVFTNPYRIVGVETSAGRAQTKVEIENAASEAHHDGEPDRQVLRRPGRGARRAVDRRPHP